MSYIQQDELEFKKAQLKKNKNKKKEKNLIWQINKKSFKL